MAEEKVNDVITWLAKVEKDDTVELPESILKSQNLLIEIEETIEIVHTKRPVVSAASNAAYEIVEKYDAVRKVFKRLWPQNDFGILYCNFGGMNCWNV